jgi:hypothetical protein
LVLEELDRVQVVEGKLLLIELKFLRQIVSLAVHFAVVRIRNVLVIVIDLFG